MKKCCYLSAVPMRKEASHRSEMVNQLLFGDLVDVLTTEGDWDLICSEYDNYEGWVSSQQLKPVMQGDIDIFDMIANTEMWIHLGDKKVLVPAGAQYNHRWATSDNNDKKAKKTVIGVAEQFLGAPYLWGGRTKMGIDCSGLSQVVFKICGKKLPRDAWQQAETGVEVSLTESREGDLAFFANTAGRIVHVGIMDGCGGIIHASGMVRHDTIDEHGIFNAERQEYSHMLKCIKRLEK